MRSKFIGFIFGLVTAFMPMTVMAATNIDPGFGYSPITGLTGGTVVLTNNQLSVGNHIDLQGTLTSNLVLQIPSGYAGEWTVSNSLVCTKWLVSIQYSGQSANSSPAIPCGSQAVRIWATGTTVFAPPTGAFAGANILHNADFLIDQRFEGTASTIATGTPAAALDRWFATFTTSTSSAGNPTVGQTTASAGLVGPVRSLTWTANATPSTTQPAGLIGIVYQTVEGSDMADLQWGSAQGLPATVSLWIKSSVASATVGVFIQNTGSAQSFVHNCVTGTAATWSYCSFPVVAPTAGTWSQTIGSTGAIIGVTETCGSTFQAAAADAWSAGNFNCTSAQTLLSATISSTLEISMPKFERGVQPTAFNPDPIPVSLAKAQRFYRKTFPQGTAPAQNAGVAGSVCSVAAAISPAQVQFVFSPPMFAVPATITTYNPSAAAATWRNITQSSNPTVSVDPNSAKSATGVQIVSGNATALGDQICIHASFDVGK